MAVAEDIDWGFVVEVVIDGYAAVVSAIVDVVVAVKAAPGLGFAAVHAVAGVAEVAPGLVAVLETAAEFVTVATIDVVVDVEAVEGEVGESIGLGLGVVAVAVAGRTARAE